MHRSGETTKADKCAEKKGTSAYVQKSRAVVNHRKPRRDDGELLELHRYIVLVYIFISISRSLPIHFAPSLQVVVPREGKH